MKSVLFATTALVASAGVAAAQDITFEGSAAAGIGYNDASGNTDAYSSVDFDVIFSGSTDNGLTFGATIDTSVGTSLDIGEVGSTNFDEDAGDPAFVEEDGTFGLGSIFISGDFGTLTFDRDGIENVFNDDFDHDFSYEYDVAGFGIFLSYNLQDSGAPGDEYALRFDYDGADAGSVPLSAFIETDDSEEAHFGVGYDITPEFNAGLEYETDGEITTLLVGYDDGMFSVDAEANSDDEWELGVGYTDQGFTINASTDQDEEWELTGAYDLGGGLSIQAGTAHTSNWYLGAAMDF
jgi:outer membrane protein OmpU